ncbi:Peroxidasin [Hypsibius exemplaris]|uniref:Peroxidasin n=1 Tax=Hypsibius exemplaris TaxID=2072580 RepID=A0A1W0XF73_HYPEX|nr:Peroxidasin [Hypsibius exemplaris]
MTPPLWMTLSPSSWRRLLAVSVLFVGLLLGGSGRWVDGQRIWPANLTIASGRVDLTHGKDDIFRLTSSSSSSNHAGQGAVCGTGNDWLGARGLRPGVDVDMAADDPVSQAVPDLPLFRSQGRAPLSINAKVIDDLTARLLPDIQRQLQEETDRTADFLKRSDKQSGGNGLADMPSARVFSLAQALQGLNVSGTALMADHAGASANHASTMKALFAFSKPTQTSVDLGEKARVFEKVTSNLKDQFGLDKDQVVGLTGVNFEGTQLENFIVTQPPPMEITVEVAGRTINIQSQGNSDPSFTVARIQPFLRVMRSAKEEEKNTFTGPEETNHYGVPLTRKKRQVQQCADRAFRDQSGRCNNLNNPTWGQSFQPYVRFLPPDYSDGVSVPRIRSSRPSKSLLPSARQVTVTMHTQMNRPHDHVTHILMQWGQFMDHDITHTPITAIEVNQNGRTQLMTPKCCDLPQGTVAHSSCFAIPIPQNDPFYPRFGQSCLEFVRSSPATNVLGPREQLNQLTSFIDASQVYGSTLATGNSLRSFSMGMMLIQQTRGTQESLLPADTTTEECFRKTADRTCFRAGDVRVNVHTGLAAMHTMWLREHNRIARGLFSMNQVSGWDDERVYQETRRILGAMFQHITFNEFLPVVLGRDIMNQFGLNLLSTGYYNGYSDQVNPSIANEFATAAYRFGHSLVNGEFRLDNQNGQAVLANNLVNSFFQPLILYDQGRCDQYLRGMTSQNVQTFDRFVAEELSNHLFQPPGQPFGNDLISRNIQRGRDHGLPGYNSWRRFCGFPIASSFSDLQGVMPDDALQRLATLYEHPDDVDLFTAGLSEFSVSGGLVGPTFACIIARQFHNLRRGDRYWYENNISIGSFSPLQLAEIRKASLARVLCDNTDSFAMQRRVMVEPIPFMNINPKLACNQLPSIDLSVWRTAGGNLLGRDMMPLNNMQQDFPGPSINDLPPPQAQQQFVQQTLPGQQPFIFAQQQQAPSPQQQQFVQMTQQSLNPQVFPQQLLMNPPIMQSLVPGPMFSQFRFRADPKAANISITIAFGGGFESPNRDRGKRNPSGTAAGSKSHRPTRSYLHFVPRISTDSYLGLTNQATRHLTQTAPHTYTPQPYCHRIRKPPLSRVSLPLYPRNFSRCYESPLDFRVSTFTFAPKSSPALSFRPIKPPHILSLFLSFLSS